MADPFDEIVRWGELGGGRARVGNLDGVVCSGVLAFFSRDSFFVS